VMKRIIDHLKGSGLELRVDQYLLIFLKFIASVLPTMEYDCNDKYVTYRHNVHECLISKCQLRARMTISHCVHRINVVTSIE
jgi:hypothetical protein